MNFSAAVFFCFFSPVHKHGSEAAWKRLSVNVSSVLLVCTCAKGILNVGSKPTEEEEEEEDKEI